jgi:hypothetical protein
VRQLRRPARTLPVAVALGVVAGLLGAIAPATAQPGLGGLNGPPPIIGNTSSGVLRDVPLEYYSAVDTLEGRAIGEVLQTHGLPDTSSQRTQVAAWARDEVRTQAFLDLVTIIKTPAADRSPIDQKIYDWFQGVYQAQEVARAQGGVDEYLKWSGLTMDTIHDDPLDGGPTGAYDTGYCNYHPPAALDSGVGLFGGAYDSSTYPLCLPNFDIRLCAGNATGCPVPWPSYEQFKAWGSYRANEALYSSPIVSVLSTEGASGIGIAATMAAAGLSVPLAARYAGGVAQGSGGLFAKVFPYAARPLQVVGEFATDAAREAAEAAALSAARISAGVTRAVSVAVVVGTIITAIVTIAIETWTIIEHAAISTKLLDALDQAKNTAPNLGAIYDGDGGAGALLMTFLSTTAIDVDPNCQLPTLSDPYSEFPCANAPDPAAATSQDDRFYVTDADGNGSLSDTIYTINPAESVSGVVMPELTRLNDRGWFVTTKYRPDDVDLVAPTNPGATLQSMRLYYRGWDNETWLAERVVVGGKPMFVISSPTQEDLGGCTTTLPDGSSACLTDTLQYLAPDGSRRTAEVVAYDAVGPTIDAQVQARAEAGVPMQVQAQANSRFGADGDLTYSWRVEGVATPYTGTSPTVTFPYSGAQSIDLRVTDSVGSTSRSFPVVVSGHSLVTVDSPPLSQEVPYGSSPDLVVRISPREGQTGCGGYFDGSTYRIGVCPSPTGTVSLTLDGRPLGDPVVLPPLRIGWACPYSSPGSNAGCSFNSDAGISSTDQFHLPRLTLPLGSHTLGVTYAGDANFGGSTTEVPFTVGKGLATVALTSGDRYPYPFGSEPAKLVATVTSPQGTAPTGFVRFVYNGQEAPEDVPIASDGTASLETNLAFVSEVTVRYLGDALFQESDSEAYPVTTAQVTDNTVSPAESTAAAGTSATLDVTLLDDLGEPIKGVTVYANPTAFSGNDGSAVTDDSGIAHIAVTSGTVGDKTYQFGVVQPFFISYQSLPQSAVVHWRDLIAPVLAAHDPVVAEATGPDGAPVTYSVPAATDDFDGSPAVSCDPEPGTTFALGVTTVTCGASDTAGNRADPAQFDVTVQDTTPPRFVTPSDRVVAAGDSGSAVVAWGTVGTADVVDGPGSATCLPVSGSTFSVGATTVTCQATDRHDNTSVASFTVSVLDARQPVIVPHDDLAVEATGPDGAVVDYDAPAVNDLDDGAGTATCAPASGTPLPLGITTITCTHTDTAGNAAEPVHFSVTVQDTTAPDVTLLAPASGVVFAAGDRMRVRVACRDLVAVVQCLASRATDMRVPVGPVGRHKVRAEGRDPSGNVGRARSSYVVAHGFGDFRPTHIRGADPGDRQKLALTLLGAGGEPVSRAAVARLGRARQVGIFIRGDGGRISRACRAGAGDTVFRCGVPTDRHDSRLVVTAWERVDGTKVTSPGDGNRLVVRVR